MPPPPPDGLPVYRRLTGSDDDAFRRRVSEALQLSYQLYCSPAGRERPRPSHSRAGTAVACPIAAINGRVRQSTLAWQPLGQNGRSLTADGSAATTDVDGLGDKPKPHKRPVIDSRERDVWLRFGVNALDDRPPEFLVRLIDQLR